MTKYVSRYEAYASLGVGGQFVGAYKTLAEAKEARGKRELNIFKSYYMVSPSGRKLCIKSILVA